MCHWFDSSLINVYLLRKNSWIHFKGVRALDCNEAKHCCLRCTRVQLPGRNDKSRYDLSGKISTVEGETRCTSDHHFGRFFGLQFPRTTELSKEWESCRKFSSSWQYLDLGHLRNCQTKKMVYLFFWNTFEGLSTSCDQSVWARRHASGLSIQDACSWWWWWWWWCVWKEGCCMKIC